MTAFAQSEGHLGSTQVQIRLKSVNHRNLKLHIHCGSETELENWVSKLLQQHLERGHVEFHLDCQTQHADAEELSQWIQRSQSQNLPTPTWSDLYAKRMSGIQASLSIENPEELYPHIQTCLNTFVQRRLEEGQAMVECMLRDISTLQELLSQINTELPKHHESRVQRFKQKLNQYLEAIDGEAREDLARECANYLERIDVQEECDRLKTHLERFEHALTHEHRGGKYCDFLCQEIHREITTLGNKSQSSTISEWVVGFKTHLEKLREQCQNLE